jgi:hypothetical protein
VFHFIEKVEVCYMPLQRFTSQFNRKKSWRTSQVVGTTSLNPLAPALTQAAISSLIWCVRLLAEDGARSKTHAFLCFQTIQGMSSVTDPSALRSGLGVLCFAAASHQSKSGSSAVGGVQVMRIYLNSWDHHDLDIEPYLEFLSCRQTLKILKLLGLTHKLERGLLEFYTRTTSLFLLLDHIGFITSIQWSWCQYLRYIFIFMASKPLIQHMDFKQFLRTIPS